MTDFFTDKSISSSGPLAAAGRRPPLALYSAGLTATVLGLLMAGCGPSARPPAPPLVAVAAVAAAPALKSLESTLRLDADVEEISFYPEIARSPHGDSVAVWEQFDGSRYHIWGNYNRGGRGWGRATLLKDSGNGHGYNPRVAINRLGRAMAVWVQSDDAAHTHHIWSSGFEAVAGWSPPTQVNRGSKGPAYAPQVALNDSGNAAAVWQQSDGRRFNVWSSRIQAGGDWSPAVKVQVGQAHLGAPSVTLDAQGNATAVWPQFQGSGSELWTSRAAAGQPWGQATKIQSLQGYVHSPQVVAKAQGGVTVRWEQAMKDGYSANSVLAANPYRIGQGWRAASQSCAAASPGLQARQKHTTACDGSSR